MNCESRVALIGIVVSDPSSVTRLNEYLHECAGYIIGRMGVPYEKAGVSEGRLRRAGICIPADHVLVPQR